MDKEKQEPLLADEKGLVAVEHGASTEEDRTAKATRGPSARARKALAAVLFVWGAWTMLDGVQTLLRHEPEMVTFGELGGTDAGLSGYWAGVAQKGWRAAVKSGKHHHGDHHDKHHHSGKHGHHDHHDHHDQHDHDHKHKHGKHGKDGKHGHHGGPDEHPHFFPPGLAEKVFLSVPNNNSVRAASHRYTDHAHIAGSGWDFLDAVSLKSEWERALGLPVSGPEDFVFEAGSSESQARVYNSTGKMGVWVDTYYPVMNTPVSSFVTLHSDPPVHAKLSEDIVEGDPDSVLRDEVRVFHGLSVSGHVKGQYVYAGYGRKKDFELLEDKGVDLKGKIVLTKYGGVFRGLKIKAAEEAGAVGVLIYSDPGDDGEFTEEHGYKAYPDGPARQPSSVQRGSVQFLSKYPGDPTTPGVPAYRNATREAASSVPKIPSLPISYEDALPILTALNGKGMKVSDFGQEWVGGLEYKGVEYWTGPSEVELEMSNEVNTRVMPIWNTMATIPGHISDEVVIVGNHRDAWVLGAADPSSGTASMHEMVRGLGELVQQGWKPLRTIILASWDAEEYGLIGSTEWTEDFGEWISAHAVAYLNTDVSVGGSKFEASASPSLAWLVRNAAEQVISSSNSSKSVWDARLDGSDWHTWRAEVQGLMPDEADASASLSARPDNWVGPLGSGSDFTSFLQRYGVAATDMGFKGGPKDAVYHYHSIYDSFTWQEKFADPGFHRHTDIAKVLGLMTLRMADSLILPINTTQYSYELLYYLSKVQTIAKDGNYSSQVDFSALNSSIYHLLNSSHTLDAHKATVHKKLHKILPKPPKKGKKSAWSQFWPKRCRGSSSRVGQLMNRWDVESGSEVETTGWPEIPHIPGMPHLPKPKEPKEPDHPHPPTPPHPPHPPHEPRPPHPPHPPHEPHGPHPPHPPHHPHHPHPPPAPPSLPKKKIEEIKRLLAEVRAINGLLQSFEGGFISEEGIRDREWYRHKGVAPGKWLGYGATTFPALTEAMTIEKSAKLAQDEADDLARMIKKMAQKLDGKA